MVPRKKSTGEDTPKPVASLNPAEVAVGTDHVQHAALPALKELKPASGMTRPARLCDLVDVQELIRSLQLPGDFTQQLDPYVRPKYIQLAEGNQQAGAVD